VRVSISCSSGPVSPSISSGYSPSSEAIKGGDNIVVVICGVFVVIFIVVVICDVFVVIFIMVCGFVWVLVLVWSGDVGVIIVTATNLVCFLPLTFKLPFPFSLGLCKWR